MKPIAISLFIVAILIGGAFFLTNSEPSWEPNQGPSENVDIVDGVQFVRIRAKGGYSPKITYAKSDIPTILSIETNNTFDCSSALVIPSLKYRANLNPSEITEIKLPPQKAGSKHNGLCSMGMYGFEVRFN